MNNNEITIIGMGNIGKILLKYFSKINNRFDIINIIDKDIVEKHNYVYDKKYVGELKTIACKNEFNNVKVNSIHEYIDNHNITKNIKQIFNQSQYIFDCRDTFENRNFKAIKLFLNNDKLIVDFRKKINYKFDIKDDYISYIDKTHLDLIIYNFAKYFLKNENKIDQFINQNNIITINSIGYVESLISTNYVYSKKILKDIDNIVKNNKIKTIEADVVDGIYNMYYLKKDIFQTSVKNILLEIEQVCTNFPSIFIKYNIVDDKLKIAVLNQTGGA